MDHRETFASAFPNGTIVHGKPTDFTSPKAIYDAQADRVVDAHLVYADELVRMNAEDPDSAGFWIFRGRAFRLFHGRKSLLRTCRTDSRIHAGAGMDGVFFIPELLESPLPKPFLYLRATRPKSPCRMAAPMTGSLSWKT